MDVIPSRFFLFFCILIALTGCSHESVVEEVTKDAPLSFRQVLSDEKTYEVQIIYIQVDRDENNVPSFTEHLFNVSRIKYFYPASTVQLPVAALALDKINRLNIPGFSRVARMQVDSMRYPQSPVWLDLTSADSLPSVEHYIHKILTVGDVDAYNRLYEFLGQDHIHDRLTELDISHTRIIHRLSDPRFGPDEDRYTNPVMFFNDDTLVYSREEVYAEGRPHPKLAGEMKGLAHVDVDGKLVPAPFDFSKKNFYPLTDQVSILKRLMFPEVFPDSARFVLSEDDYSFLWREMSLLPRESNYPVYPAGDFNDGYAKFFMFGDKTGPIPENIRIFNRAGTAYGYLTDCAYIADYENNVEFILAATVHVNANDIYNDGEYEVDEVGIPFLGELGRQIYNYELTREKAHKPDLSRYKQATGDE